MICSSAPSATSRPAGGLAAASAERHPICTREVSDAVQADWEQDRPVPPRVIWERTLEEARSLALTALTHPDEPLKGQRSFAEVPFGGQRARDAARSSSVGSLRPPVEIPGTSLRIGGFIDRLDLSGDGTVARVRDYKTGRSPKADIVLDGGKELQRCLYAFAVKALVGRDVEVEASLLYPRDGRILALDQPDTVLDTLAHALACASDSLAAGRAVPGPDSGDTYNELAFALPANAASTYCKTKAAAVAALLGPAAQVWEAP